MKTIINIETIIKTELEKTLKKIETQLEVIDLNLSFERDKTKYISQSKRTRMLITEFGIIKLKRRIYKYQENSQTKFIALLDEKLNLKPFERIMPEFKNKIIQQINRGKKYKDIIEMFPKSQLSESTISNILKQSNIKEKNQINKPEIKDGQTIHINIDDTYLTIKSKNKKIKSRVRVYSFNLGIDKVKSSEKRKILKDKRICFKLVKAKEKIDSIKFAKRIYKKGQELYKNFHKAKLIVHGDGDRWIKEIAVTLGAKYILDKWHAYKYLKVMFINGFKKYHSKNQKKYQIATNLFKNGKYDYLLNFLKNNNSPNQIYKYFKNNKMGIENQTNESNIGSCTESDIFNLVKRNLNNNTKCYNKTIFKNMLIAQMNKINSQY